MDIEALKTENERLTEQLRLLSTELHEFKGLKGKHEALEKEHTQLLEKKTMLEFQLLQLQRLIFSSRRERHLSIHPDQEQLSFDFGELAPVDVPANTEEEQETVRVLVNEGRCILDRHRGFYDVFRRLIPGNVKVEIIQIGIP